MALNVKTMGLRATRALGAAMVAVSLAGCVEIPGAIDPMVPTVGAAPQAARAAARSSVNPGGASVAFVSVEGAPPEVIARFSERTAAEAAGRDILVASPVGAHYLVKGYLSASEVEGGTAFRYVWDVFDKSRRRVQRTEDAIVVKGSSPALWALANDQALTMLATRSADDLAAILAQMPEAANGRAPAAAAIAANAPVSPPLAPPTGLRAYR